MPSEPESNILATAPHSVSVIPNKQSCSSASLESTNAIKGAGDWVVLNSANSASSNESALTAINSSLTTEGNSTTENANDNDAREHDNTTEADGTDLPWFEQTQKTARKVGVAIVGGSLIVIGVPLIPLPGPGFLTILGGFTLLSTEFPAAQGVLDGIRNRLVEAIYAKEDDDNSSTDSSSLDDERNDKEIETDIDTTSSSNGKPEMLQQNTSDDPKETRNDQLPYGESEEKSVEMGKDTTKKNASSENNKLDLVEESSRELKRQAQSFGKNFVLPVLNRVCTDLEGEIGESEDESKQERDDHDHKSEVITS
eukprot:CAMPEP_0198291106 /NCGR_PEP_ID=MMETSP1449-20131203/8747_1 /TAXON_ID=420275 /ORGANISM="Attheya septentrionalis, Strain CCMP2084" /LENGTH=311 /DNA_ID=CAMNT_0043989703 /DNA_START=179 /DNA_END=1114 /DNA_ORIENTATION=-